MRESIKDTPDWLIQHRESRPYRAGWTARPHTSQDRAELLRADVPRLKLLADKGFNRHSIQDGSHVSPFDQGMVLVGIDGLKVRLAQGVNEQQFKDYLSRAVKATTGLSLDAPVEDTDWEESMKGGLQMGLESQVLVFEVEGASRALTHQLVRSTRARFQQQSQRATWYGCRPNVRVPESIMRNARAAAAFEDAVMASWRAYEVACDEDISYQDARYALLEGTVNYISCQYSIREFINVFAYRGCTGFLWEMTACMHEMRRVLLEAHPFLEPYVKISCEKPQKCTFQGWENVEGFCSLPWANQDNRTFLPTPKFRINDSKKETN